MRHVLFAFLILATTLIASSLSANAGSIQVVKTEPVHGASGVSPALTEIKVTFSAPMRQDSYSFVINNEKRFPDHTADPYYLDEYTCVLPVKLEPDTEYSMLLNAGEYWSFVGAADGQPAESYELTFTTGPAQ